MAGGLSLQADYSARGPDWLTCFLVINPAPQESKNTGLIATGGQASRSGLGQRDRILKRFQL